jgi:hypothetical protein
MVLANEVLEPLVKIFAISDELILGLGILGYVDVVGRGGIDVKGTIFLVLLDHLVEGES